MSGDYPLQYQRGGEEGEDDFRVEHTITSRTTSYEVTTTTHLTPRAVGEDESYQTTEPVDASDLRHELDEDEDTHDVSGDPNQFFDDLAARGSFEPFVPGSDVEDAEEAKDLAPASPKASTSSHFRGPSSSTAAAEGGPHHRKNRPSYQKVTIEDGPIHSRASSIATAPMSFQMEKEQRPIIGDIPVSPSPLADAIAGSPSPPIEERSVSAAHSRHSSKDPSRPPIQSSSPPFPIPTATAINRPPPRGLIDSGLQAVESSYNDRARSQSIGSSRSSGSVKSHDSPDSGRSQPRSNRSNTSQHSQRSNASSSRSSPRLMPPMSPESSGLLASAANVAGVTPQQLVSPNAHDFSSTQTYEETLAYGAAGHSKNSSHKLRLKDAARLAAEAEAADEDEDSFEITDGRPQQEHDGMYSPPANASHRGGARRYETNASLVLSEGGFESPSATPIQGLLESGGSSGSQWQQVALIQGGSPGVSSGSQDTSLVPSFAFPPTLSSSSSSAFDAFQARGQALRYNLSSHVNVAPSIADRLADLLIEKEHEIYNQAATMRALALHNSQRNHDMIHLIRLIERSKSEYNNMLKDLMSLSNKTLLGLPEQPDATAPRSPMRHTPFQVLDPDQIVSQQHIDQYLQKALPQPNPNEGALTIRPLSSSSSPQNVRSEESSPRGSEGRPIVFDSNLNLSGSGVRIGGSASGSGPSSGTGTPKPVPHIPQPTQRQRDQGEYPQQQQQSASAHVSRRGSSNLSSPRAGGSGPQSVDGGYVPSRIHSARESSTGSAKMGSGVFPMSGSDGTMTTSDVPPINIPIVSLPTSAPVTSRSGAPEEPIRPRSREEEKHGSEGGTNHSDHDSEPEVIEDLNKSRKSSRGPSIAEPLKTTNLALNATSSTVQEIWDVNVNESPLDAPVVDSDEEDMDINAADTTVYDEHDQDEEEVATPTDEYARAEHFRQKSQDDKKEPPVPTASLQQFITEQWNKLEQEQGASPPPDTTATAVGGDEVQSDSARRASARRASGGSVTRVDSPQPQSQPQQQPKSPSARVERVDDSMFAESPASPFSQPSSATASNAALGVGSPTRHAHSKSAFVGSKTTTTAPTHAKSKSTDVTPLSAATGSRATEPPKWPGPAQPSAIIPEEEVQEEGEPVAKRIVATEAKAEDSQQKSHVQKSKQLREAASRQQVYAPPRHHKSQSTVVTSPPPTSDASSAAAAAGGVGSPSRHSHSKSAFVGSKASTVAPPTTSHLKSKSIDVTNPPTTSAAPVEEKPKVASSSGRERVASPHSQKQQQLANAASRQKVWDPETQFTAELEQRRDPSVSRDDKHSAVQQALARQHVWAPESHHVPTQPAKLPLDQVTTQVQDALREEKGPTQPSTSSASHSRGPSQAVKSTTSGASSSKSTPPKGYGSGSATPTTAAQVLPTTPNEKYFYDAWQVAQKDADHYKDLVIRLKKDRLKLKAKIEAYQTKLGKARSGEERASSPTSSVASSSASSIPASVVASGPPLSNGQQQVMIERLVHDMKKLQHKFKSETKEWSKQRKGLEDEIHRLSDAQSAIAGILPQTSVSTEPTISAEPAAVPAPTAPSESKESVEGAQSHRATSTSSSTRYPNQLERDYQLQLYEIELAQQELAREQQLNDEYEQEIVTEYEVVGSVPEQQHQQHQSYSMQPYNQQSQVSIRGRRRSHSPIIHILPNGDVYDGPSAGARRISPEYLAPLSHTHALSHQHVQEVGERSHQPPAPMAALPPPSSSTSNARSVLSAPPTSSSRARSISSSRYPQVAPRIRDDQLNRNILKPQEELDAHQQAAYEEYQRREKERQQKLEEKREQAKVEKLLRRRRQTAMAAASGMRPPSASTNPPPPASYVARVEVAPVYPVELFDEEKEANYQQPTQRTEQQQYVPLSDEEGYDRYSTQQFAPSANHRLPRSSWNGGSLQREVEWQQDRAALMKHEAHEGVTHLIRAHVSPPRGMHRFIREEVREQERQKLFRRRFGEEQ